MDNQKILIFAGIAIVVVLFLAKRTSSGSASVISAGGNVDAQMQSELARESLKVDAYKSGLSIDLEKYRIDKTTSLSALQTNVAERIGLASVNKAAEAEITRANADREIAQLNNTLSLASIGANLQAFLAGQATLVAGQGAELEAARLANLTSIQQAELQTRAAQSVATAQRNSSIFNGIFSIGRSIIDSILNKDRDRGGLVIPW